MRILLALLFCLVAIDAHAASFPCAKAKSKVEKLICADATLSKLDEELAAAFKQANTDWDATASDQKDWLRAIRDKCGTAACLAAAYRARIEELRHWHDPVAWSDEMQGSYMQQHSVEIVSDTGSDPLPVTDCLRVSRGKDGRLLLHLDSTQVNGHSCTVDMAARKEKGAVRTVPEGDETCALELRVERGLIVVDDSENTCEMNCGARAHLDGLAFRRSQRQTAGCELPDE